MDPLEHRVEITASSFQQMVEFHHALIEEFGETTRFKVLLDGGYDETLDAAAGLATNLPKLEGLQRYWSELELPRTMSYLPENMVTISGRTFTATREWWFIEAVVELWEECFDAPPPVQLTGRLELPDPQGRDDQLVALYLDFLSILLFRYGRLENGLPRSGVRVASQLGDLVLYPRNRFRLDANRRLYYDPTLLPGLKQRVPLEAVRTLRALERPEECCFDLIRRMVHIHSDGLIRYEVLGDLLLEFTREALSR